MAEKLESPFVRPLERENIEVESYLEPRRSHPLGALGAIAICQAVGVIAAMNRGDGARSRWYRSLDKPEFTPQPRVSRSVWALLYSMMGIALHQLWRQRHTRSGKSALRWFAAQLGLNAAWVPAFFGKQSITGGMAVAAASAIVAPISIAKADRVSRPAGLLLLPHLGWIAFMAILNAALVSLNPRRVRHEMKESREFAHF